jgi:UDP-3-O-[3-hydroxymyristoyl] glucosamine N-acyltransferase
MMTKKINVNELIEFLGDNLISIQGDYFDVFIDNLADIERVNATTLDWINPLEVNKQEMAESSKAKVLIVDRFINYSWELESQKKVLLVVGNPKLELAKIGNNFFVEKLVPTIHPTAIIDPKAEIGNDVYIGPYAVIGKSFIGDSCIIDSNVRIYNGVTIGVGCKVKSGAVLGGEGFGYEIDENGNRFSFPQLGGLVVGNYVEIGSNTTIDRGALSDTVIGDFTKINNLCHIAHNNKIGKNVVITGCVNISGSNTIDDYVWIAPNASIRGWIHIGKGATIGIGSVVTKNIPAGETWVGNPARKQEKK